MPPLPKPTPIPEEFTAPQEASQRAIDVLYKEMVFWEREGKLLVLRVLAALDEEKNGRLAAELLMKFKDVDDRCIEVAAKLAPYQSAKLASMEVNKKITKRFVIVAPQVATDNKEWLERVHNEEKLIQKPIVITKAPSLDDTIDEIAYADLNE